MHPPEAKRNKPSRANRNTGSCGATKGALAKLMNNEIVEDHITEMDYQMNTLERLLFKAKASLLNAKSPLYEATEVIYEAIDKRVHELIEQTKYPCGYAILMGSLLIKQ